MKWRSRITKTYADGPNDVRAELRDGASPTRLDILESQLGLRLPPPLRELLLETDGADVAMLLRDKWSPTDTIIWSCDEIAHENATIRSDPEGPAPPPGAPEAVPLYFANAGVDGILFAFLLRRSGPEDPAVYAYYPIEGEWRRISPTLEAHLCGWKV